MLLLHGFGVSFNIWRNLLPLLCPYFSVVMVELPGIGESPLAAKDQSYLTASVESIERLRSRLGIESWNVLGYSTGSRIAESYARAYPSRLRNLIFLCPLLMSRFLNISLRISLWLDKFLPAYGDFILTGWRFKMLISLVGFNLKPNNLEDEWFEEMSGNPRNVLKDTLRMIAPLGTRPFDVPVPASFIWGDDDIVPVRPRRPGSRDFFVHGNHAAPMLAADEVAAVIIRLLIKS